MSDLLSCLTDLDPARRQELDPLDGRFQSVASQVLVGHYERAAQDARALFVGGIYDIRLACYILLGHLQSEGPGGLASLLDAGARLVEAQWDELGPQEDKAAEMGRSLDWLNGQILSHLRGMQKARGIPWQGFVHELSEADALGLVERAQAFEGALAARGIDAAAESGAVLTAFLKRLWRDIKMGAAVAEEEAQEAPPPAQEGGWAPSTHESLDGLTSPAPDALLSRLRAYERLCHQGDFVKASVLIDGLNQALGAFDPRLYFPQIFSPFYATGARHIVSIELARGRTDPLVMQQLEALVQVDLEGFVALTLDEDEE